MKLSSVAALLFIAMLASLLASSCGSVPQAVNAAPPTKPSDPAAATPAGAASKNDTASKHGLVPDSVTVPAGTAVSVRLQSTLSSASNRAGDHFAATLDEPIVVDGRTIAPRGAAVSGRVVAARPSGRLHNSGYLRLALTSIVIEGKPVPIQSSSIFSSGGAHKKRNAVLIGGGAGTGAVIGALAGGGKGALIGAAVGAGAGTAGAAATGKKDVTFATERRLTFRLTHDLLIND